VQLLRAESSCAAAWPSSWGDRLVIIFVNLKYSDKRKRVGEEERIIIRIINNERKYGKKIK